MLYSRKYLDFYGLVIIQVFISYWNYRHAPTGENHHEYHPTDVLLGAANEIDAVVFLARRYARHANYWLQVPARTRLVRYEDLRTTPLPELMDILAFLLPNESLPPLERLACTVELHEAAQAYHSAKAQIFSSWNNFTPELRKAVLQEVLPLWCRYVFSLIKQILSLIPTYQVRLR